MSTAKHTPGDITVKRGQFGSSVFVLYGADGFPIAQTVSNSSPEGMERARRGEHEANAQRLALCWNVHDDLVRELRLLNIDENGEQRRNTPAWRIIAKATGSAT